jgi:hypothetical protein
VEHLGRTMAATTVRGGQNGSKEAIGGSKEAISDTTLHGGLARVR